MTTWFTLPEDLPTDSSTVWIRIKYYYGVPFKAVWSLTSQQFTSVDNSIVYPAWTVARWKNV
jgi:hypothetical protein